MLLKNGIRNNNKRAFTIPEMLVYMLISGITISLILDAMVLFKTFGTILQEKIYHDLVLVNEYQMLNKEIYDFN